MFKFVLIILIVYLNIPKTFAINDLKDIELIKVALIKDEFKDYKNYIEYELSSYSSEKKIEYQLIETDNLENENNFDIIFGEYNSLTKYSKNVKEMNLCQTKFYEKNNIEISEDIFPIDLDSYLIFSNKYKKKIQSFQDLSKLIDPLKYTIGFSLVKKNFVEDIFIFSSPNNLEVLYEDIIFLSNYSLLSRLNKNINKFTINSDHYDLYNSYINNENLFTIFEDGIILNKDFKYQYYQLFPQSNYQWDDEMGIFKKIDKLNQVSFFGLSVKLINDEYSDFFCFLTRNDRRKNAFENFNLGISPLSRNEVLNISVSEEYLKILDRKKNNIINLSDEYKNIFTNNNYIETKMKKINDYMSLNYLN